MCVEVLLLRTAIKTKEGNLWHTCTLTRVPNLEQKMQPNKEWLAFFHNIKNKQYLSSLFVTYICADDFVQPSPLPILGNNENQTFQISIECNHEEFDTRMIFHALQQKANVVVCLKDEDLLALVVFVYAPNKINEK